MSRPIIDLTANASLFTGESKCPLDPDKVKGAIVVDINTKLPAKPTADKLEELAHASGASRIFGISEFVEYAKEGGEQQTSTIGYGPEEITGFSSRKDNFTLKKYNAMMHSSVLKNGNKPYGVYYYDDNNVIYGINDGTDVLAPFPVNCIMSKAVTHPTSSAKASQNIIFAMANAKQVETESDFNKLSFNPRKLTLGLTPVQLIKNDDGTYKIIESIGGTDVTSIYGPLIAAAGTAVLTGGGASAATYDAVKNALTIATTGGAIKAGDTGVRLKAASVLFTNNIKGIEQV